MAVKHYMKPGLHQKTPVRIITVNVKERYIEAALKDGAMIHVLVSTVPAIFQWPMTGEVWTVWRENGYWKLGERVESPLDDMGWVESLEEGDTQITGRVLIQGSEVAKRYTTKLTDLASSEFVVKHNLDSLTPNIVIWESPKQITTALDCTDTDTIIWFEEPYFNMQTEGWIWFGSELVLFTNFVADSGLYKLTGCTRGIAGTTPLSMDKGTIGQKVLQPNTNNADLWVLDANNVFIQANTVLSNYDDAYWSVTITA